jgi:hypothetical protein
VVFLGWISKDHVEIEDFDSVGKKRNGVFLGVDEFLEGFLVEDDVVDFLGKIASLFEVLLDVLEP